MGGVIFLGGTPAIRQPFARAMTKSPTWSGDSISATTPVLRTTKSRSFWISRCASSWHWIRVSRTSSVTAWRESFVPSSVSPKISSPGFGGRMSRLMLTVLLITYDLPVSRLTPVRIHLVVVFPISTEATIK